ncbi:MAG: AsmA family protein [Methylovirgula sp.]
MREILTILAIILIIILTAALAVPYFIDWNAERHFVEAQLSNLTGAEVKIRGGIDLKILPTPYLQLEEVELSVPARGTDVNVAELHLEIALMALTRGEVDFVEAQFVDPHVRLRLENEALPLWRPTHGFTGQMRFERISVTGGSLTVDDPAVSRAYHFDNIVLSAEADALTGPFRGDGHFDMAGAANVFRFSTGTRQGASLPLKAIFDENARHPGAGFDGNLVFDQHAAEFALPSAAGTLHLTGSGPFDLPWQASGTLSAALRKATLSGLEIQIGNDLAANLDGSAAFDLAAPASAHLKLHAQQLDLDRLLTAKDAAAPSQRLFSTFTDLAAAPNISLLGLPLGLDFSADTLILGGEALGNVAGAVAVSGPQRDAVRFSAGDLVGAHIAVDGQIETGAAPAFKGHVAGGTDNLPRLNAWLAANLPKLALPDWPLQSLGVDGAANISQVGAVGSDLTLRVNGSVLTGTLAYTKEIAAEPARLFADLSAQRLELPSLPDLSALAQQTRDMDLGLRFDAQSVKLAGSRAGAIETGQIQFDFEKTGAAAVLKSLHVSGFDGANVTANGRWNPQGGDLALQLDARRVDEIAALVAHLAPSPETNFIAAHSAEFSPTHLGLAIEGTTDNGAMSLTGLSLAGTAGETRFLASGTPGQGKNIALSLRAQAPDGRALLRQFGFATVPGKRLGEAAIDATAHGSPDHLDTRFSASVAGANLDFTGDIAEAAKTPRAAGTVKIASADLSALLRALGLAAPDLAITLPLDVSAAVQADGDGLVLRAISGSCAGNKIAGSLSYSGDRGVTSTLQTDALSLGAVLQLALGPPRPVKSGQLWSSAPFAAPIKLPPALVAMHVGVLGLAGAGVARDADFNLALAEGQVGLKNFSAKLGGGRLLGDLTLRRSGATAAAEGHMSLDHYALDLPTAKGTVSGKFDLAGTGQSADALIAGLAGSGAFTVTELLLLSSDPGALARVLGDVEEDRLSLDETEIDRALSDALDQHALEVANANFDASLVAGVLRFTGKGSAPAAGTSGVTQDTQASLDLKTLRLDQSSVITLTALPRNWSGAPPQVGVEWTGPLKAPVRNLDATSFVNALAARAIARETARIEAQEFDVHEHAVALNRLQSLRREEADRQQASADVERAAARARERQATLDRLRQLLTVEQQKAQEKVQEKPPEKTEEPATQKPLPISPVPQQAAPAPTQPQPVPADPSAAGRY